MFNCLRPHGLQHAWLLSSTTFWSLLKFMSAETVMLFASCLILCCPLVFLPSIFPSIRVFSNESPLPVRWPKYWSFSFSTSPSNEYSGLNIHFFFFSYLKQSTQSCRKCALENADSFWNILLNICTPFNES